MSFYDIADHDVRDRKIEEYIALKNKIKRRNLNVRTDDLKNYDKLVETYKPIVKSQEQMTRDIVEQLKPISENLAIKKQEERPIIGAKRRMVMKKDGPLTEAFRERFLEKDINLDKSFGVRYDSNHFKIGNKSVHFQDDNIVIDGKVYEGTPGLWSLIIDEKPKRYNDSDLERYKELLHETSVLRRNYESDSNYPRSSRSPKWTRILSSIWEDFKREGIIDSDSDDDDYKTDNPEGEGLKMYLQRSGRCFDLKRKENGILITPRPQLPGTLGQDGLFVRVGPTLYDGHGLLLGSNSPFRKIPILGWIL